jgi:mycothiol synthase
MRGTSAVEFRSPTAEDVDGILRMLLACDVADFGTPDFDRDALLAEWAHPEVDLERDAFLADGAYGILVGGLGRAWVAPPRRGNGLGSALAERLEARARDRGLPHIDQQTPCADPNARALLEGRGYEILRTISELRLDHTDVDQLPAGPVRPYDAERDQEALQALFERELSGGRARLLPLEAVLAACPDTSLWFCVDGPDGEIAAGVRSELRPSGFIKGHIAQVAVTAPARKQGLGGRLVGAAAREMRERGAHSISVNVRSDVPEAAAFFDRLGFRGAGIVDELRLVLRP